jgi:hypothetical protein
MRSSVESKETMAQDALQHMIPPQEETDATPSSPPDKHPWQAPKLTFVEPKLTPHGTVQEVTGQSFGTFPP